MKTVRVVAAVIRKDNIIFATQRGYGEFTLGDTIEVDVSDYDKINYPEILQWLENKI